MDVELEPSSGLHHQTWFNGTLLGVGDVMIPNIDRCRQKTRSEKLVASAWATNFQIAMILIFSIAT